MAAKRKVKPPKPRLDLPWDRADQGATEYEIYTNALQAYTTGKGPNPATKSEFFPREGRREGVTPSPMPAALLRQCAECALRAGELTPAEPRDADFAFAAGVGDADARRIVARSGLRHERDAEAGVHEAANAVRLVAPRTRSRGAKPTPRHSASVNSRTAWPGLNDRNVSSRKSASRTLVRFAKRCSGGTISTNRCVVDALPAQRRMRRRTDGERERDVAGEQHRLERGAVVLREREAHARDVRRERAHELRHERGTERAQKAERDVRGIGAREFEHFAAAASRSRRARVRRAARTRAP